MKASLQSVHARSHGNSLWEPQRSPAWLEQALCRTHPEPDLWHGDAQERAQAAAVCRRCPVTAECLQAAVAGDERRGVWGGQDLDNAPTLVGTPWPVSTPHGGRKGVAAHAARAEEPCEVCAAGVERRRIASNSAGAARKRRMRARERAEAMREEAS